MNLAEIRAAVRLDLADEAEEKWETDDLTRAIQRAVWDLSRQIPQEKLYQHKVEYTIADETFNSGARDVAVALSGNPIIVPKGETVTSKPAGTDYTRDTDYTMDYLAGTITVLSTGGMGATTDFLISYGKSKVIIDVSSLTDLIRVSMVEYPAGKVPMETVSFSQWGDDLEILGGEGSQEALTEDEYMFIYYQAYHTMPTEGAAGSFPTFLDEVIAKGGAAYALLSRALNLQHNADDRVASAVAALVLGRAVHTSIASELSNVDTEVALAGTALAKVATEVAKGSTALDKVDTHGSAAGTALSAVAALISSGQTALGKVQNQVTAMSGDLADHESVWASLDDYIVGGAGIKGAQPFLEDGRADYINKVTLGADAAELMRRYSDSEVTIAGLWGDKASRFIAAAQAQLGAAEAFMGEGAQHVASAQARVAEGTGRVAVGSVYVAEATQRVASAAAYVAEADQRLAAAGMYMQKVIRYREQIEAYLAEAAQYLEAVGADMALVEMMKVEAIQRRNEFWEVLKDRKQYMKRGSTVSRKQYS